MRGTALQATLVLGALALALPATAQINKELVERAPQEERAPMPHIDPDNPDKLRVKQDASTNIWRAERDAYVGYADLVAVSLSPAVGPGFGGHR